MIVAMNLVVVYIIGEIILENPYELFMIYHPLKTPTVKFKLKNVGAVVNIFFYYRSINLLIE